MSNDKLISRQQFVERVAKLGLGVALAAFLSGKASAFTAYINADTTKITGNVVEYNYHYFGDPATDGSWRFSISSGNLIYEKKISGSWYEQGRFEVA